LQKPLCVLSLSLSLSLSLASRPIFRSAKNSPVRRDRTRPLPLCSPPIHSHHLADSFYYLSQPLKVQWLWLEWTSSHQCTSSGRGRSSRFGMNQKHILFFCPGIFSPFLCLKIFPPLTSLISFPIHCIAIAQESSKAWIT
jgi:hypothetical protein